MDPIDTRSDAAPDQAVPRAMAGNRIASLDFIRGIAVMGILAANIIAFGQPFAAYMYPDAFLVPHSEAEQWMWIAQFVLIDGKMRGLFTLLFGAGLYLFMEKAWSRGEGRALQARRLGWLLLFGLGHFFLIWRGDILTFYALFGLVSLAAIRWAAKTQLVVGLLGYAAGVVLVGSFMLSPYVIAETEFGEQPAYAEMREQLAADKGRALDHEMVEYRIISEGSYGDFVAHNVIDHKGDLPFNIFVFGFETLPLMLIGMALYRFGLFSGAMNTGRMLRWGSAGIVIGSGVTLLVALWVRDAGFSYWSTLAAFMSLSALPRLPVVLGLAGGAGFRCGAGRFHQLLGHIGADAVCLPRLGRRIVRRSGAYRAVPRHGGKLARHARLVEALARPVPLRSARMALAVPDLLAAVPPAAVTRGVATENDSH